MPKATIPRAAVLLLALAPLGLAACDPSSHDENLAGYALLFGGMFVIASVVGFVLVAAGLFAAFGGSMALVLNVVRPPSAWSRTAGIGFGIVNACVGLVGTVLLAFLSIPHESRAGATELHTPSMQSVLLLMWSTTVGMVTSWTFGRTS